MKNKALSLFFALIIPQLCLANHGALNGIGTLITMLFIALAVPIVFLILYPLIITYRASKDKASHSSIIWGIGISYFSLAISLVVFLMGGFPAIFSLGLSLYCIRQLHHKKNNFAPKTDSMLLDDI